MAEQVRYRRYDCILDLWPSDTLQLSRSKKRTRSKISSKTQKREVSQVVTFWNASYLPVAVMGRMGFARRKEDLDQGEEMVQGRWSRVQDTR